MKQFIRLLSFVALCVTAAPATSVAREKEGLVYEPTAAVLQTLSADDAAAVVKNTLGPLYDEKRNEVRIDKSSITVIYGKKKETKEFMLADIMPQLMLWEEKTGDGLIFGNTYRSFKIPGIGLLGTSSSKSEPGWRQLVDALYVLKMGARIETDPQYQKKFDEVARRYRSAAVKPELPEDARRYKVQAEAMVRQKDFERARNLYQQALEIAPWWPDGHFNLALQLAEARDFAAAITEMKRYLALAPDAPDARAAQDKVYEWELEVPQGKPASQPQRRGGA
jgi:tetratricopeptide (TPR) repeat protein